MGIGRTFKESLQKALVSLEDGGIAFPQVTFSEEQLTYPNSKRIRSIYQAFREGQSVSEIFAKTKVTPWFLEQIQELVAFEQKSANGSLENFEWMRAKRLGFSDAAIAQWFGKKPSVIRKMRWEKGLHPAFLKVDTCAGEFASETPYFYSTYWSAPESPHPTRQDDCVVLLGSGPNRIGQGIEFDYSCVRSVKQFQTEGYKVIMVNSNPETVSTDYDTSNQLFFEPLTTENVLEILRYTNPKGFVAQLGGQTPIRLAPNLVNAGFELLGSSLQSIDRAEDRGLFIEVCNDLGIKIPKSGMAFDLQQARVITQRIGFPIICRPSYVLGGRRMEIIENQDELDSYFERHRRHISKSNPCLMDQFLERALEIDVDLVRGPDWSVVGGVIEHIERAGVHSGDSMGVLPPQRLKTEVRDRIEDLSRQLADRLGILGFLNLQLAVKDDEIYILEANPRSSRSVPFMAKSTHVPLVGLGVKAILGRTKEDVLPERFNWKDMDDVCVKGVVFPFTKFSVADYILGPEMKSTGESMGRGRDYSEALLKAFISSHHTMPDEGEVFFSLRDKDKDDLLGTAEEMIKMGFSISATAGTAAFLKQNNIPCLVVKKVHEGRPHCVDRIRSGKVVMVINTASGRKSIDASFSIRRSCIDYSIPCLTESDAARSFVVALRRHYQKDFGVYPLGQML